MNPITAEALITRLTNLALTHETAQKLLSDEAWMEERVMDAIEAVTSGEGLDDQAEACQSFAREFCAGLIAQYPNDVTPGFDLESLDSDEYEDDNE